MTVTPKFEINNLVNHKFDKGINGKKFALEVIEVQTQTCYAGTQIFYLCRSVQASRMKEFTNTGITEDWMIDISKDYVKVREDELIEAPQEIIDLILNHK